MACAPQWVTAYVDGELDVPSSQLMEDHLASCSRCTDQVRAEKVVQFQLRSLPEPPNPVLFLERLTSRRWVN